MEKQKKKKKIISVGLDLIFLGYCKKRPVMDKTKKNQTRSLCAHEEVEIEW